MPNESANATTEPLNHFQDVIDDEYDCDDDMDDDDQNPLAPRVVVVPVAVPPSAVVAVAQSSPCGMAPWSVAT